MYANPTTHLLWRPWSRVGPHVLVAWLFWSVGIGWAQDARGLEYEVKGAFLVKFGMFVEWSASAPAGGTHEVFTIGVLGKDPFGKNFDEAVKNERIGGRPIQVKRVQRPSELAGCQIVFISSSESGRLSGLISELSGKGILIVADEPGFAGRGGMIGFIKESGKVRFEINLAAAERSGLRISSKLLQVGKQVTDEK